MGQACIIIGASHAGAQLALSMRKEGWRGSITVIGDEAGLPYHRPPLSKGFLSGDMSIEDIQIRPNSLYEKQDIAFLFNTRVAHIDREKKVIALEDGRILAYDKLALGLGARARTIDIPGSALEGVHYLRTVADATAIHEQLAEAKSIVIVGGGYIGLELAASIRKLDIKVTVLEMLPRVLARVTAPDVSAFYTRVHGEEGVEIETNTSTSAILGSERVTGVECSDGRRFSADVVIIGVGVLPNVELAEAAGLDVDNGILVDEFGRTSDPDIVAAGDCTNHPNPLLRTRIRLESVPNAIEQAKSAAAALCGRDQAYSALPWFWSDQFDLKLQIAGMNHGYDDVVIRGSTEIGRSFAAFYLKEGRVIAADCVNRPKEFMATKKALSQSRLFDTTLLADEKVAVQDLLLPQA